ncbi:hypothetical protein B0H19DRAFT_1072738 [Mycena capillaripes]|nr:hypothetical protein B0H19DRAFT_1072738 [Mycena capillaripes]
MRAPRSALSNERGHSKPNVGLALHRSSDDQPVPTSSTAPSEDPIPFPCARRAPARIPVGHWACDRVLIVDEYAGDAQFYILPLVRAQLALWDPVNPGFNLNSIITCHIASGDFPFYLWRKHCRVSRASQKQLSFKFGDVHLRNILHVKLKNVFRNARFPARSVPKHGAQKKQENLLHRESLQAVSDDPSQQLPLTEPIDENHILRRCVADQLAPVGESAGGATWSVTNVPSTGLKDITFPITIVEAKHSSGYFFAQQYEFAGAGIGYTGIQPRPDANGKPVLHGVFSSFVGGSTTSDPNCTPGADGGPGVSCSVEWNGVYGRTYDFEVKYNPSASVWVGTAIDTVTGARIHIGSYKLPAGAGGIQSTQAGFVEWFLWNDGRAHPCTTLPYQKTIFGHPRTTHLLSIGVQGNSFEYGDCVGKVAFRTQQVLGGVENNCGF